MVEMVKNHLSQLEITGIAMVPSRPHHFKLALATIMRSHTNVLTMVKTVLAQEEFILVIRTDRIMVMKSLLQKVLLIGIRRLCGNRAINFKLIVTDLCSRKEKHGMMFQMMISSASVSLSLTQSHTIVLKMAVSVPVQVVMSSMVTNSKLVHLILPLSWKCLIKVSIWLLVQSKTLWLASQKLSWEVKFTMH